MNIVYVPGAAGDGYHQPKIRGKQRLFEQVIITGLKARNTGKCLHPDHLKFERLISMENSVRIIKHNK